MYKVCHRYRNIGILSPFRVKKETKQQNNDRRLFSGYNLNYNFVLNLFIGILST